MLLWSSTDLRYMAAFLFSNSQSDSVIFKAVLFIYFLFRLISNKKKKKECQVQDFHQTLIESITKNFGKFDWFDVHSIDLINRKPIEQLNSIDSAANRTLIVFHWLPLVRAVCNCMFLLLYGWITWEGKKPILAIKDTTSILSWCPLSTLDQLPNFSLSIVVYYTCMQSYPSWDSWEKWVRFTFI